jgi:hypothetical protein
MTFNKKEINNQCSHDVPFPEAGLNIITGEVERESMVEEIGLGMRSSFMAGGHKGKCSLCGRILYWDESASEWVSENIFKDRYDVEQKRDN